MPEPLVSIKNLTFIYTGSRTPALRDVSLEVLPGEYVAVLGLNDAGKTTLALSMNGVVPHMLTGEMSGTVEVAGHDVADYPVREMAKLIGVVFDNPEFQMSQMTVAEEVALGLESAGVPHEEMVPIVKDTLALVGLEGLEERSPLELSGGQQQRLAIAAVLAMKPRLLIMDEPTSNLDPQGKREVFEIAARLNREQNLTVVIVEHEVEMMAAHADRVVVLDRGRVVLNGPPREVLAQVEEVEALGLRPPQVTSVAYRLGRDHGLWDGPMPVVAEEALPVIDRLIGATDA